MATALTTSGQKIEDTSPVPAPEQRPTAYHWYVAVVLMFAYTLSFIDRKLPFILVESIKRDLSLSDTQIGLLTGAMFALVYSTVAIPIAAFSDRNSRKNVIALAIFVWSGLTALGGFAQNFWQLAGSRIGVAVGEAACTPAAHSIIAGTFTTRYRARALGLYFVGSQIGIVLGLALGGWINQLANWRVAMFLLGIPGAILAIVVFFTIKEPLRPTQPASSPAPAATVGARNGASFGEAIGILLRQPTFVHLMIAALLASFTSGAVQAFTPAYLIRTFHLTSSQVGLSYGLTMGAAGATGALLGGYLGDRLRQRSPRSALRFVGLAMLVAAPCMVMAFLTGSYSIFLLLIFVTNVCHMSYAGPGFATIQSLVEPRMHAFASAVYLFALSGIGLSLGPLVVGALSDWQASLGSTNSLRWALLAVLAPSALSSIFYFLAARKLPAPASAA